MKVAIIGANGQLGHDLVASFSQTGNQVLPLTHAEIEIASLDSVRSCLGDVQPQIVVNTAAMHHVETCEGQPEAAYTVNAVGARNLAAVTGAMGTTLIHLSTDYVFDGAKNQPYVETDLPLPLNVYGNTKLAGEHYVRAENPKHFVLRTSALYGDYPCRAKGGLNFVELMLKLARERGKVRVVNNEIISPTSTSELSRQIVLLSRGEAYGLYHATGEGACSWYEFAAEVFRETRTKVDLQVAAPDEFVIKVPRPKYSALENHSLKQLGINQFKPWQVALREYLSRQCLRSTLA
jgi:dTDP-4-dehydrorhamnose reductase